MFSGSQEILLIVLIIAGVFVVPRLMKPRLASPATIHRRPSLRLSWTHRLAIVLSILWPLVCALFFKPWQNGGAVFAVAGIGPVVVGWSVKWVYAGMKNKR